MKSLLVNRSGLNQGQFMLIFSSLAFTSTLVLLTWWAKLFFLMELQTLLLGVYSNLSAKLDLASDCAVILELAESNLNIAQLSWISAKFKALVSTAPSSGVDNSALWVSWPSRCWVQPRVSSKPHQSLQTLVYVFFSFLRLVAINWDNKFVTVFCFSWTLWQLSRILLAKHSFVVVSSLLTALLSASFLA